VKSFVVNSPEMMARFGALIAKHIVPGDVIALVGDLGAGKTTLTQGLVEALGGQANSPTFSLVNEYEMTPLTIWTLRMSCQCWG
jgi:tRNA threonylcarbamoyladenosine biosynthesis protein TsaE